MQKNNEQNWSSEGFTKLKGGLKEKPGDTVTRWSDRDKLHCVARYFVKTGSNETYLPPIPLVSGVTSPTSRVRNQLVQPKSNISHRCQYLRSCLWTAKNLYWNLHQFSCLQHKLCYIKFRHDMMLVADSDGTVLRSRQIGG